MLSFSLKVRLAFFEREESPTNTRSFPPSLFSVFILYLD